MQISIPRPPGLSCVAASVMRCDAAIGVLLPPICYRCVPGSKIATTRSRSYGGIVDKKQSTTPRHRDVALRDAAYAACNRGYVHDKHL